MNNEDILREQFNNVIDQDLLDEMYKQGNEITGGISKDFTVENIFNAMIDGKSIFDNPEIIKDIKELFFYEVKSAVILGIEIISICIIIGLIKNLSTSFGSKSVTDISLLVCTMIIIGISIENFKLTYNLAIDTVNTMAYTMGIMAPILLGILIATGGVTSGTILSPMIIGSVSGMAFILKTIVLPALFVATVLGLINCLTEKDYVNKLSKLLRNAAVVLTGLLLVILTGIITIQGLLTDTTDSLLINTAKYSLSTFIPIVGNFTSDTVELFLRCMTSIKSVTGIFGIIFLLLLVIVPIIKIVVIAVIYKITAALTEPVTDNKISSGLNDMGSCLISIASIMFFTALLFIMFITTIMKMGGQ